MNNPTTLTVNINTDSDKTAQLAVDEVASALEYEGFSGVTVDEPVWVRFLTESNLRGLSKKARTKLLRDLEISWENLLIEHGLI
jgi:hypothetical protein